MVIGYIEIPKRRPTVREFVGWYARQVLLRLRRRLTTDEWYAADCPPYAGQRPPWRIPSAREVLDAVQSEVAA